MTMTKKVAVINDLSGLGRCSLTAAISVLSAMGIQTCPLPTAILSSQTEYPSYYCYDFTDKMDYFRQEWKKLGTCFSGIYISKENVSELSGTGICGIAVISAIFAEKDIKNATKKLKKLTEEMVEA